MCEWCGRGLAWLVDIFRPVTVSNIDCDWSWAESEFFLSWITLFFLQFKNTLQLEY